MRSMIFRMAAVFLATILMVSSQSARADMTFKYTDSYNNEVTGTLQTQILNSMTNPSVDPKYYGYYQVIGGTATISSKGDFATGGLAADYAGSYTISTGDISGFNVGSAGQFDNLLIPPALAGTDPNQTGSSGQNSSHYLDLYGLVFTNNSDLSVLLNLYDSNYISGGSTGLGIYSTVDGSLLYGGDLSTGVLNVNNPPWPTPEPSSYALTLMGLCCLAAGFHYRRKLALVA